VRQEARPLVLLILAAACWGLGTVISKRAVEAIPPITLLVLQLAASLVVLGLALRRRALPPSDRPIPPVLARLGILNPGIAYALTLVGLTQISASLSVLLWTTEPLLIIVLAAMFLGERIGPAVVSLSAVAALGMVLVLYEPGLSGSLLGIAVTLIGVACCAVYTVVSRRFIGDLDLTGPVVVAQQTYALAFAAAAFVVVAVAGVPVGMSDTSPVVWASAIGSGVLYYGAAYLAYLAALRRLAASIAAASFYLIPVFGIAGGVLLLDERLASLQWIGAAIVLVAVATILRRTVTTPGADTDLARTAPLGAPVSDQP